jgi:drug/metabolite transporter (DMT)-like permease
VALFTALGFVPISLLFGDTSVILTLDAKTWCITFFAGVLPLSIGYPCFNYAQKHLGASFCSTITLFTPVMAYVLSFIFLPDEFLLPIQIIGATILLAGALIVTAAHYRVTARIAPGVAPAHPTISEAEAS